MLKKKLSTKLNFYKHALFVIPLFLLVHDLVYGTLHYESNYQGGKDEERLASMYTFEQMADFALLAKSKRQPTFNPQDVFEGAVVIVQTNFLSMFFEHYHPYIKNRYILLTQHSDNSAPKNYEHFLEDSKIIAWLGRNPSIVNHPKFFPIPIGIKNRKEKANPSIAFVKQLSLPKKHLLYLNFDVGTNPKKRRPPYHFFHSKKFCFSPKRKPQIDYFKDIAESCFVLSPEGNGLDCFRTYEAIILGSIPIVETSPLDPLFEDLPVVIVKNWEEITEDFLLRTYEEMKNQTFCLDILYIDYWKDFIQDLLTSTKCKRAPPVVLASFPRSGNTWMRYCLEYLTKRPAFFNRIENCPLKDLPSFWNSDFYFPNNNLDNPLVFTYPWFETDLNQPAIIKSHQIEYTKEDHIPILFLLRDYKEAILREHLNANFRHELNRQIQTGCGYFHLLKQFDSYKGKKLLVYYDDLVFHPEIVLPQVLKFLNESDDLLSDFLDHLPLHQNHCIELYKERGGSKSRGKALHFHKNKLSHQEIKQIDKHVMESYPELFEKYLKKFSFLDKDEHNNLF